MKRPVRNIKTKHPKMHAMHNKKRQASNEPNRKSDKILDIQKIKYLKTKLKFCKNIEE